jgi:hypothetical protein
LWRRVSLEVDWRVSWLFSEVLCYGGFTDAIFIVEVFGWWL